MSCLTHLRNTEPVRWYRTPFYNATILGFCSLAAPGPWDAMNSLGAGGAQNPTCAGPYTNNRFGTEWLDILGATLCGISAEHCWKIRVYCTPDLHCAACLDPFVALLLNKPEKVPRPHEVPMKLQIYDNPWQEIKAVYCTYIALWLSVRARSLGSILSSVVAIVVTNLLGAWLDTHSAALKKGARWAFGVIMITQGVWWIWLTINVTQYSRSATLYGWADEAFGRAFAPFIFLDADFQLNYNFAFFLVGQISTSPQKTIRLAAPLRGTESAWQALSYGLNAFPIFVTVGGTYFNFGLGAVALLPV
ncbi:hypothetical protein BU25DRAFT_441304 [Macroventuria anomochaeta]|uniref:Uncharacterized protein n=1 Tax=Macroventuria anomochaeta TaxID=301207 RepID=A0ACB6RU45_9PLEO|nr:uncharacterized protein BU25DRAFT_441304 [Macroventuria anomochaeta]KAF2625500.1 hypothetical protein BU25DRAFT_441304 [Macroventuria anomochaeta]